MSEEATSEFQCEDAEVNDLFKKGLESSDDFYSPFCVKSQCPQRGSALEYRECSEKDAAVLRRMLTTGPPVRKLCVWEMPLKAFKIAFDDLEGCSSLKELHLFDVDCEEQDFSFNLCGVFSSLQTLELHCSQIQTAFARDIATFLRENKTLREFALWYSCGGDEGAAALVEALKVNDTLRKFTLAQLKLSSETLISFAKMLATNKTLECVDLFDCCTVEAAKVSALAGEGLYKDVFKRLRIVWTGELLPLLTGLVRRKAFWPEISVSVTSSVDQEVLREFFDAVAADTTATMLHFLPDDDAFDALADGIATVAKRTTSLKVIQNLMHVKQGNEHQLVKVLDALKENRSVTSFYMYSEVLTPELATSLSELLAVNDTLNEIGVCEYWGITADDVATILRGLRNNYTVTMLMVSWDPDDDVEGVLEMQELVKRNVRLHMKAAEFVCVGASGENAAEGADALKKVHSSAKLVERVQTLTGKPNETALDMIQAALTRVSA